jgi:hypothetical protein
MKRVISTTELFATMPPSRVLEMLAEAGPRGLTCPEMVDAAFPGLDADECDRVAAILERAMGGKPEYD